MSGIDFITIERGQRGEFDTSTLALSEREHPFIEVLGVLPHGSKWRPQSARDRDRLVSWLESLNFDGGTP